MNNWMTVFGFAIVTSLWVVEAQENSLAKAKTLFESADRKLNEAYGRAKQQLSDWAFSELKEEQRQWLSGRDERAKSMAYFNGQVEEGKEEQSVDYWEGLAALTETRTEIIQGWVIAEEFEKDWEGVWIDGNGGMLQILEMVDGTFRFRINVVRGPTYHLGDIGGIANFNTQTARFATDLEGAKEETWLTFIRRGIKTEIIGENTMYFHGARAFFDGEYVRVRQLNEQDKNEILNPPEY